VILNNMEEPLLKMRFHSTGRSDVTPEDYCCVPPCLLSFVTDSDSSGLTNVTYK
jgi:hypothetical protein